MTYILIVVMHVYAGNMIAFQEFNSETACRIAQNQVAKRAELTACVPKG